MNMNKTVTDSMSFKKEASVEGSHMNKLMVQGSDVLNTFYSATRKSEETPLQLHNQFRSSFPERPALLSRNSDEDSKSQGLSSTKPTVR